MKKNNGNSNVILKSKKQSWINSIFSLFVIAIPALLVWIFFTNDFINLNISTKWWIKVLIAFGFIIITSAITLICVYIKILNISIFNFTIPVSIAFMVIFVTTDIKEIWIRAIAIIPCFFLIIPTSIIVKKIETKALLKNKLKNKNSKIIGYKEK